ncbi:phosphotransacetylase [Desulfonispora thiosulfatigenes DSM 11270]|uniref:Phosphate acetyltransferase n=1 Tax=Desulfonispora thiosulfatigenes DSM 11270 TaxID=656914 RepID=A0A1W1VKT8_DESTI|nr:phosphate acetyltransferase [Desulfonispora thiosulfatigenes]SMB93584.1 phosphotransacetylase [Desulfonispora thiosulfatigenes DSM 11270]
MNLIESIKEKAKAKNATIVLPEGTEERTVQAAGIISKEGIANVILLGKEEEVKNVAKTNNVDLSNVQIIFPENHAKFEEYANTLFELRKAKGMTLEDAKKLTKNSLYFGALMVKSGDASGMVAGAENTTGNVLRPALQIIKTEKGISSVSGAFIMIVPNSEYGEEGITIFADCAVNPVPTAEQMAENAFLSARTAKDLVGFEPKVAMLSFSSKGSAKHELVEKVANATQIAKERYPELIVDGELQADAALVPSVGTKKAPDSKVAGRANVLVFPDLQAGNIGYKLVERFAKGEAIGPILQGMAKPVNDLSRGCSVDDVVNTVAITALQS